MKLSGRDQARHGSVKEPNKEKAFNFVLKNANQNVSSFFNSGKKEKETKESEMKMTSNITPKIVPTKKPKTNLKQIENTKTDVNGKVVYTDLPLTSAVKQNTKKTGNEPKKSSEKTNSGTNQSSIINVDEKPEEEVNELGYFQNYQNEEGSDDDNDVAKYEGYLYKLTETKKLKKLWFKLLHRDLYYFKNDSENVHKGMHNLSGVYVNEEKQQTIDGFTYYTFSVVYPKKVRYYFVDNETDFKKWIAMIKRATGYTDLNDIYEVKEKLGNGKFGLVRLGIHRQNGRKVAIKIMNKKDMNNQDLELVKTEIEILKDLPTSVYHSTL